MEHTNWRFGVVANITQQHIGDDGNPHRGTKAFTAGTKVYLAGKHWDSRSDSISVIGRNRFGRLVLQSTPIHCLERVRTQRIYKPHVLAIIDYLETADGWSWWARTAADRSETEQFVKAWEKRLQ